MDIMTVRAPDGLQKKLKEYAQTQGLTRNALVLQILWEWIGKHDASCAGALKARQDLARKE